MTDATEPGAPNRDGRPGAGAWPDALALLLVALRKSLWLILLLAILFALLAAAAKMSLPQKYAATSQVLIDPRSMAVFANEPVNSQLDSNSAINFVESQMQVLTSERVLSRVVAEEKLAEQPDFARIAEAARGSKELALQTALARMLTVKRQERSFIVDVTATAADAALAARIANAVVQAFIKEDGASRADSGRRLTRELTGRLTELREKLSQSEAKAEEFRLKNGLVSVGDRLVVEQKLETAVADVSAAQVRSARAQARVDQLDKAKNDLGSLGALTQAEDMRTVSFLIERLSAARENLADLNLNLGARHPALTSARSRVDEIEQRISAEFGRIRSAARADLIRAKGEEAELARQSTRLSADVSKARQSQIELRAREQEVEANRALLGSFETRSREADEFGRIAAVNVRVVSVALPPNATASLTMAIAWGLAGFVFGAMLGCAVAALRALIAFGRPARDRTVVTKPARSIGRIARKPAAPAEPTPAAAVAPATAPPPARPDVVEAPSLTKPPVGTPPAAPASVKPGVAIPPPSRPSPLRAALAAAQRPTPLQAAFERARRESLRGR